MAQYTGKTFFTLPRPLAYKNGVNIETIAANKTLTYFDSQFQILTDSTASASREVLLPEPKNGAWFLIRNDSSAPSEYAVKSGGSTVATVQIEKGALFVCDGSTWALASKGE